MMDQVFDRKTAIFYLSLLALVVLDLILVVWLLSPSNHFGTSAYASERPAVSDTTKVSPFEIAESKASALQGVRRRQVRNAALQNHPE